MEADVDWHLTCTWLSHHSKYICSLPTLDKKICTCKKRAWEETNPQREPSSSFNRHGVHSPKDSKHQRSRQRSPWSHFYLTPSWFLQLPPPISTPSQKLPRLFLSRTHFADESPRGDDIFSLIHLTFPTFPSRMRPLPVDGNMLDLIMNSGCSVFLFLIFFLVSWLSFNPRTLLDHRWHHHGQHHRRPQPWPGPSSSSKFFFLEYKKEHCWPYFSSF